MIKLAELLEMDAAPYTGPERRKQRRRIMDEGYFYRRGIELAYGQQTYRTGPKDRRAKP